MASIDSCLDALVNIIKTVVATQDDEHFVYKGWPQPEELEADIVACRPNISVYCSDHGERVSMVGAQPFVVTTEPTTALAAAVSSAKLTGGSPTTSSSGTLTFTGTSTPGTIMIVEIGGLYVPVSPPQNATMAVVANTVANALNASTAFNALHAAVAAANVVTITKTLVGADGDSKNLGVKIGGTGEMTAVTRKQTAPVEVHVWAYDNDSRRNFADAVDDVLADTGFLLLDDGTTARLMYKGTAQTDAEIRHGVYRRILRYTVEYVRTKTVPVVSVLETLTTITAHGPGQDC
jgi:hypothetical protein